MRHLTGPTRHRALDRALDGVVIVAALMVVLDVLVRDAPDTRPAPWLVAPLAAPIALPLLARHRFPFAAPVLVWVLAGAWSFVDPELVVDGFGVIMAGAVAAALLGHLRHPARSGAGLVLVVAMVAVVVSNGPELSAGDYVSVPVMFASAWLAGYALALRAEQVEAAEERAHHAEERRRSAALLAAAEERAHIARELHDVVGHAVSVMVLRVGAVRLGLPAGQHDARDALSEVERTGRTALAEMRQLVAGLRNGEAGTELAPQPSLARIEQLAEPVRRAGLPVRLRVDGEVAGLPETIDRSAYRIVQEGLTNALKHARARHVEVTILRRPHELRIEVRDDGRGSASDDRGLAGIRERVKVFGGELAAGAGPDGGYVLAVGLPTDGPLAGGAPRPDDVPSSDLRSSDLPVNGTAS